MVFGQGAVPCLDEGKTGLASLAPGLGGRSMACRQRGGTGMQKTVEEEAIFHIVFIRNCSLGMAIVVHGGKEGRRVMRLELTASRVLYP